jgi:hypothetical protein
VNFRPLSIPMIGEYLEMPSAAAIMAGLHLTVNDARVRTIGPDFSDKGEGGLDLCKAECPKP